MGITFQQLLERELGVTKETYNAASRLARQKNSLTVQILIEQRVGNQEQILDLFSRYYKVQVADLTSMDIPPNIIDLIPTDLAQKLKVIPIDRAGNNIIVAMANPQDLKVIDLIRFKTGYSVKPVLATEAALLGSLEKYYSIKSFDITEFGTHDIDGAKSRKEARAVIDERNLSNDRQAPIIRLVDQILVQCLARRASDIHIEPYENALRVRLRIDGVLQELARPPIEFTGPLISRIKIMGALDIAEKRLPQDGGIRVIIANKPIDFRVSTLPTMYGEKIVLRLLDKSSLRVDLTKLGFEPDDYAKFKEAIYKPYGIVLVTGPTGSGKTTTLYSALSELNKISDNIVTAEDPVEYNLDGINQVQVNLQIGLDFPSALRAFLRQDPDIIMVGEIRDLTTAEIAIKAALTGHLVLSTLHTNSAADTIIRLQNMGLESFNIISALNCVVAQRLMRKICDRCRTIDESVSQESLVELGLPPQYAAKVKAYAGKGCDECNGTGYRGRTAVHEVMVINDPIREVIMKQKSAMELKAVAMQYGMRSLRQNALNKLVRGEVDVFELVANTNADSDIKNIQSVA